MPELGTAQPQLVCFKIKILGYRRSFGVPFENFDIFKVFGLKVVNKKHFG